jgi:hypothetical protein
MKYLDVSFLLQLLRPCGSIFCTFVITHIIRFSQYSAVSAMDSAGT